VGGRSQYNGWLYVKFDRLPDFCWVSNYVVDVVGDPKTVTIQPVLLWITDALYLSPENVRTERKGDQVTISWDPVYMTVDDDRGYFLDLMVCQNLSLVWLPMSLPDQYHTTITVTDQAGCNWPSHGQIYTVEKARLHPSRRYPLARLGSIPSIQAQ